MRKVTIKQLYEFADDAREGLWKAAKEAGAPGGVPHIYLHWSAGHYRQMFDDYHVNITGNGDIYVSTEDFRDKLAHTWHRNSGSVGIALDCAYNADTNKLGPEPPTAAQIEAIAQAVAAIADGLWITICKKYVLTHGEAAANEDGWHAHPAYAPWNDECHDGDTRWDLEYLGTKESPKYNPWATDGTRGGDVLRGKALWYHNQRKEKNK